jgi:predicted Zn-dependent protease
MILVNPFTRQVLNAEHVPNPRGCNQHTGPSCRAGTRERLKIKALARKASADVLTAEADEGERERDDPASQFLLQYGRSKSKPSASQAMRMHETISDLWRKTTSEDEDSILGSVSDTEEFSRKQMEAAKAYKRMHQLDR